MVLPTVGLALQYQFTIATISHQAMPEASLIWNIPQLRSFAGSSRLYGVFKANQNASLLDINFLTQCNAGSLHWFFFSYICGKKTYPWVLRMSKLLPDSVWQLSHKVNSCLWKLKLRGGWRAVSAHKDMGQVALVFGPETLHCSLAKHTYMRTQSRTQSICFVIFHFTTASEEANFKQMFLWGCFPSL